jgi:hypothetical protein
VWIDEFDSGDVEDGPEIDASGKWPIENGARAEHRQYRRIASGAAAHPAGLATLARVVHRAHLPRPYTGAAAWRGGAFNRRRRQAGNRQHDQRQLTRETPRNGDPKRSSQSRHVLSLLRFCKKSVSWRRISGKFEAGSRPAGFEPATPGLEGRCSIQLSYGRLLGIIRSVAMF